MDFNSHFYNLFSFERDRHNQNYRACWSNYHLFHRNNFLFQKMTSKRKQNGRVVKWLIFPTLIASLIGLFIFPPIRLALALYVGLGLWSLNAYRQKTYQEEIYGIRKGVFKRLFIGYGIGGVFLLVSYIAPSFSLLTPTLSLSVSEDIRWAIIVLLAPIAEEYFRSATIGYIRDIYKSKFWTTNIAQAVVFALLHVLVYGVALHAYDRWIDVYGSFGAVSGSLIAAFGFGLISGYMMDKFKGIIPSVGAHQIINFWLVREGMIVVALVLSLII